MNTTAKSPARAARTIGPVAPQIGVFISYSNENASLARKLKDKLELLKGPGNLEVFVATELGGENWRKYLWEKLKEARILILLYTSPRMKLDWCSYELGRFHVHSNLENNYTICLKNTDIKDPPDQVSEWQAYPADQEHLRRFFTDLFLHGKFSGRVPLNPRLKEEPFATTLESAVADLEAEFAAFRVQDLYYPFRITLTSPSKNQLPSRLDFGTAVMSGDPRALQVLGVDEGVPWTVFRQKHSEKWITEFESAVVAPRGGSMTRALTPFSLPGKGVFIPVVSKIETFESRQIWRVNIIFVEVEAGLDDMNALPPHWQRVLAFLNLGLRFRWEDLAPAYSIVSRRDALESEWKHVAESVFTSIEQAQKHMQQIEPGPRNQGINREKIFSFYAPDLQKKMKKSADPYYSALAKLRAAIESGKRSEAEEAMRVIKVTNSEFMQTTLEQMQRLIKAASEEDELD